MWLVPVMLIKMENVLERAYGTQFEDVNTQSTNLTLYTLTCNIVGDRLQKYTMVKKFTLLLCRAYYVAST